MFGSIDLGHAALADLAGDAIAPEGELVLVHYLSRLNVFTIVAAAYRLSLHSATAESPEKQIRLP